MRSIGASSVLGMTGGIAPSISQLVEFANQPSSALSSSLPDET